MKSITQLRPTLNVQYFSKKIEKMADFLEDKDTKGSVPFMVIYIIYLDH